MKKQPKKRLILSQLLTLFLLLALIVPSLSTAFASAMDEAPGVVLSFDSNGGSGEMPSVTLSVGQPFALPENSFTPPEGQSFKAWEIAGIAGTEYQPGDNVTLSGDTVLTAVWSPATAEGENPGSQQVTASYDPNGGSGTMEATTLNVGDSLTLPENGFAPPEGQSFKAWSINGEEHQPGEAVTISGDTVLTAVWGPAASNGENPGAQQVTVSYDPNGGSGTMEATTLYVGESLTLPVNGFTPPEEQSFKAWEIAGTEYQPGEAVTFNGDAAASEGGSSASAVEITVKAVWERSKTEEAPPAPKRAPAQPKDVSDILKKEIKVTQGTEIQPGGTLKSDDFVGICIDLTIPLEGDGVAADQAVHQGDTAVIEISKDFTLNDKSDPPLDKERTFSADGSKIGTYHFFLDNGVLKLKIVFDGDEDVFTASDLTTRITNTLTYITEGDNGTAGDHPVTIMGENFTVNVPEPETIIFLNKKGEANLKTGTIKWTCEASAKKENKEVNLDGCVFSDDLNPVGDYAEDSFKLNDSEPAAPVTYDADKKLLTYTFSEGSQSPQTITFETKIPDEEYRSLTAHSKTNIAKLSKDEKTVEAKASVTFQPKWITKEKKVNDNNDEGATEEDPYHSTGRKITWTITANVDEAYLPEAIITDKLPEGLIFDSAKWYKWQNGDWVDEQNITPTGEDQSEYHLGNINTKVQLVITTRVPDSSVTVEQTKFTNTASIKWSDYPGITTKPVEASVGFNAIEKKGELYATDNTQINWTVTVKTRGQNIPDLVVYDLLVYGKDAASIQGAEGFPDGVTLDMLKPQINQKYVDGSFTPADGSNLKFEVVKLTKEGQAVADLLVINNFPAGNNVNTSFSFRTQVTNPAMLVGNKPYTIKNTASLYSANNLQRHAPAEVLYVNKMLLKEMLKCGSDAQTIAGASNATRDPSLGFDYQDHSAIFRVNVNADGIDLPNADLGGNKKLGPIVVEDKLPEGWEFVDFAPGTSYYIYEGTGNNDKSVTAVTQANVSVQYNVQNYANPATATLTFTQLDKPYVILLKAQPKPDKLKEYFSKNDVSKERNTVTLFSKDVPDAKATASQDVTIKSAILSKTVEKTDKGDLEWTLKYLPAAVKSGDGLKVVDTLPQGVEILRDAGGHLDLSGIKLFEMQVQKDGSYQQVAEISGSSLANSVYYDAATREFSFIPPELDKAYHLTFTTAITGNPGLIVNNQAELRGITEDPPKAEVSYTITGGDAEATLTKAGWFKIQKTDGSTDKLLPGVVFTIYAEDGSTIIQQAETQAQSPLFFKGLLPGSYILKETKAADGYHQYPTWDPEEYRIKVSKNEKGKIIVTINGESLTGNLLVLKNYKIGLEYPVKISKLAAGQAGFLKGAKLVLNDSDGKKLDLKDEEGNEVNPWVTDGTPKELKLLAGVYTLVEEAPPAGYLKAAPITFRVNPNGLVEIKKGNEWEEAEKDGEGFKIDMVDEAEEQSTPVIAWNGACCETKQTTLVPLQQPVAKPHGYYKLPRTGEKRGRTAGIAISLIAAAGLLLLIRKKS